MKEDLPEKQGLKPPLIIIRDIISKHERGSSRKTRIETPAPPSPVREVSGMKEDLPEKQGLKHPELFLNLGRNQMKEDLPEKQGLKLEP